MIADSGGQAGRFPRLAPRVPYHFVSIPHALAPPRALTTQTLQHGARVLARRDPDLARLLRHQGPPPLWGRRPGFATLFRIILEQQVSLAAARTLSLRIEARLGGITAESVSPLGVTGLRRLGLTRQKAAYCYNLADAVLTGRLDLARVARASDPEGQQLLLAQPGIGPWSVAIYYLMALRRPDVWPAGDLALADAIRRVKRLRATPTSRQQATLSATWAPWRSVAARLLWHYYLTTPRSAR